MWIEEGDALGEFAFLERVLGHVESEGREREGAGGEGEQERSDQENFWGMVLGIHEHDTGLWLVKFASGGAHLTSGASVP